MNTKRPPAVIIAAILLVVVSLFVASLGIASQYGLLRRGGIGNRAFIAGQPRNRNFAPQSGLPSNGINNGQSNQGTTPNFTFNRPAGTGLASLFRLVRPITLGLDIVLLILSVIAAIGLFTSKRWGVTLAIVLAVLLILLAIPGMLRIFSTMVLVENLVRILLAVAVIVLLLLPASRKSFATVDALDLDTDV